MGCCPHSPLSLPFWHRTVRQRRNDNALWQIPEDDSPVAFLQQEAKHRERGQAMEQSKLTQSALLWFCEKKPKSQQPISLLLTFSAELKVEKIQGEVIGRLCSRSPQSSLESVWCWWWTAIARGTLTSHLYAAEAELKMRKRYLVSILQCLPPILLLRLIHLRRLPESQKRQRCYEGKLKESRYKWIRFMDFSCVHLRDKELWAPVGLRSQLCSVDEELAEIWGYHCGLS